MTFDKEAFMYDLGRGPSIKDVRIFFAFLITECPTQRLTTSDQILKIEKSHMAKSKPCFEIFELKSFKWHLETWENQIGSIFKFKIIIKKNNKNFLAPYHLDLHHHYPAKFHPAPPPPPGNNSFNCQGVVVVV